MRTASTVADTRSFQMPARPMLGPLPLAGAAACLTAYAAEALSWTLHERGYPEELLALVWICIAAGGAAVFVFVRRRGSRYIACCGIVLAAVVASFACSCAYWAAWERDLVQVGDALSGGGVEIELVGDAAVRDYGTVSAARVRVANHWANIRLVWPDDAAALAAGHKVCAGGTFKPADASDAARWNHMNGFAGTLDARQCENCGCASGLRGAVCGFRDASFERIRALGADAAGLLAGVLIGNRTLYAASELEQAFRTTGLAHLMAVSGTHLAVVSALVMWLATKARMRRKAAYLTCMVMLVAYVALTGFSPSAVRSCAMCAVGAGAGLFGRRSHVLSALGACAFVFVLLQPPVAFSLGFQLSVLAVFGLVTFSSLAREWVLCVCPRRLDGLAGGVAVTLAATLPTLPITVSTFAQLPLIGPLASLLAAPFITFVLASGIPALCLADVAPFVSQALLGLSAAAASACAFLVRALAAVPYACIPLDASVAQVALAAFAAGCALWAFWPLPNSVAGVHARSLACATCLAAPVVLLAIGGMGGVGHASQAFIPGFESPSQVVMVDVGQGDAMLVRDADACVLVDTGEFGDVLKRGLARNGVTHIDAVYITHKDADHCGALSDLAGVVAVDHVYVHADLLGYEGEREVLEAARRVTGGKGAEGIRPGDSTRVGSFTLTLLAPQDGGQSENEDSLVNLLAYDSDGDGLCEACGLLTGDAEGEAIADACERCGDVDFVKVGHHGSKGAFTERELEVLKPEIALIGVGAGNDYGHPTKQTLDMLEACGARVFRTDLDGDIAVSFSKERIGVSVQRDDVG